MVKHRKAVALIGQSLDSLIHAEPRLQPGCVLRFTSSRGVHFTETSIILSSCTLPKETKMPIRRRESVNTSPGSGKLVDSDLEHDWSGQEGDEGDAPEGEPADEAENGRKRKIRPLSVSCELVSERSEPRENEDVNLLQTRLLEE